MKHLPTCQIQDEILRLLDTDYATESKGNEMKNCNSCSHMRKTKGEQFQIADSIGMYKTMPYVLQEVKKFCTLNPKWVEIFHLDHFCSHWEQNVDPINGGNIDHQR